MAAKTETVAAMGPDVYPPANAEGSAEKTVRTKQVLLRLWTRRLKAVNLMRVINEQLQICLDVNIVTLFC